MSCELLRADAKRATFCACNTIACAKATVIKVCAVSRAGSRSNALTRIYPLFRLDGRRFLPPNAGRLEVPESTSALSFFETAFPRLSSCD